MWCLVSGGGDNGAQREETKAQLTPFSPSCVWLSLGIVRPSAALQSTHLEKETNPILPAGIKPLTPLFSPLVFLYFCLLSVGIFQAPSLLFSMKENWWMCVCVCVCVCVRACVCKRARIHSSCYHFSHMIPCYLSWSVRLWLVCHPPHHWSSECVFVDIWVIIPLSITVTVAPLWNQKLSCSCCN